MWNGNMEFVELEVSRMFLKFPEKPENFLGDVFFVKITRSLLQIDSAAEHLFWRFLYFQNSYYEVYEELLLTTRSTENNSNGMTTFDLRHPLNSLVSGVHYGLLQSLSKNGFSAGEICKIFRSNSFTDYI